MRIQRNIVSVNRLDFSFYEYGKERTWGESNDIVRRRMPVMTYAGFGSEMRDHFDDFPWERFDYIICDEMQNLVKYREYDGGTKNVEEAASALLIILATTNIKVIALSATPEKIREAYGKLCYDVPFDSSDLKHLETLQRIPYSATLDTMLGPLLQQFFHQTGIFYVTEISKMKKIIDYARSIGIRANGFWSVHASDEPMSREQHELRRTVLEEETIPDGVDLLVINAASETCIKINAENRKVDYMVIHNDNADTVIQVRGRYHGDLPILYYHNIEDTNLASCATIPEAFLNKRLYHSSRFPFKRREKKKWTFTQKSQTV